MEQTVNKLAKKNYHLFWNLKLNHKVTNWILFWSWRTQPTYTWPIYRTL